MQNDNVYTVIFMFKEHNFTNSVMLPIKYVFKLCYQLIVSKYIM